MQSLPGWSKYMDFHRPTCCSTSNPDQKNELENDIKGAAVAASVDSWVREGVTVYGIAFDGRFVLEFFCARILGK